VRVPTGAVLEQRLTLVGPCARIDLGALTQNLAVVRRCAPGSRIWAVIKADAYGHGMTTAARALRAADGLAVARVGEALALRAAGIDRPLLALEGAASAAELVAAAGEGIATAIHREGQIDWVQRRGRAGPLAVWVKVDTGMHRLGLAPDAIPAVLERLSRCPGVRVRGLMTHLANADDPADPLSAAQCEIMGRLAAETGLPLSIGNSAGILAVPESRADWVRPGIMLYGASPFPNRSAADLGLKPVMTLATEIIAVKHLKHGDPIGYGGTWRCPHDMPVGVAAVGYGDGYPRQAPSGTPVLVRGTRCPLVGRGSMDMIHLDLRPLPDAGPGDPVTLWGQGLPVEDVAGRAGTISYELLCRVTPRVPREPVVA
jgi:alanine racemase